MANILLIDDEESLRALLKMALERKGHVVFDAPNGLEAREILQGEKIDLVITDILMPEVDGIETIRDIRRVNRDLKIIAISGGWSRLRPDFLPHAEALGADLTMAKPFQPSKLLEEVNALLGQSGS